MKTKNLQLLYPENLLFRIKGQIKSFPDKKKLKKFISIKAVLYEMLKGLLKKNEKKIKNMNNKMAINTCLLTTDLKNKWTNKTEIDL